MTRMLSILIAALAFSTSAAFFAEPALAQPNVTGPVRQYQRPAPQQPAPPTNAITGVNRTQDVLRAPRFKVEAVRFEAADESGPNSPGSDEVFVIFSNPRQSATTELFENVDTDDVVQFPHAESCIWPMQDTDRSRNHAWSCDPDGGQGPVSFSVFMYELDPRYALTAGFCIELGHSDIADGAYAGGACDTDHSDLLFHADFNYGVTEILNRLRPDCRCFEETAAYRQTDWRGDSDYQLTFRITRVDTAGEPLSVDPHPDAGGPAVLRSGALTAQAMQSFELDTGSIVAGGGDFALTRGATSYLLTPGNGAKIWLGNASPRGYATCFAQRMSANYVTNAVNVPAIGAWACYVTSDGHVGELRVTNFTSNQQGTSLTVNYTTWQ